MDILLKQNDTWINDRPAKQMMTIVLRSSSTPVMIGNSTNRAAKEIAKT